MFQLRIRNAAKISRLLSTILFMKQVNAQCGWLTSWNEDGNETLQDGINLLWDRLAFKSEYLACRLYLLDTKV